MQKPLVLTEHARFRMHLRRISKETVEHVVTHPVAHMRDVLTDYQVVVGRGAYGGRDRLLAVIYEETGTSLEIVTVHPIRQSQYIMRVRRRRWQLR